MSENTNSAKSPSIEDIRISYPKAIDIWLFQSTLNWNRFNVMLVVHSILIVIISAAPLSQFGFIPIILSIALAAMGLFLCHQWKFLMERGFAYRKHWTSQVKELEKELGGIETVKSAKTIEFADLARVSDTEIARRVIKAFDMVYIFLIEYNVALLLLIGGNLFSQSIIYWVWGGYVIQFVLVIVMLVRRWFLLKDKTSP